MTPQEAIAELDAMNAATDAEIAHGRADSVLLAVLDANGLHEVAVAWERARNRVGFWYA